MLEDEKIVELFFARSEQAIQELDIKYGKVCRKISYNIVNNRQDAEECVNDTYLGAWNTIPPAKRNSVYEIDSDIAARVGLSENNVAVRLNRIRQKMKQYLIEREVFI